GPWFGFLLPWPARRDEKEVTEREVDRSGCLNVLVIPSGVGWLMRAQQCREGVMQDEVIKKQAAGPQPTTKSFARNLFVTTSPAPKKMLVRPTNDRLPYPST
ncbi:unnamed protein product, partial [Ectocarpus sp. 12 AP-2014]